MADQSRRDILIEAGKVANVDGVSTAAATRAALAQKAHPIPASEWDYRTAKELTQALQARKISASELAERAMGLRGAVLSSGVYDLPALWGEASVAYYGADPAAWRAMNVE